jgi:hypothetical protein
LLTVSFNHKYLQTKVSERRETVTRKAVSLQMKTSFISTGTEHTPFLLLLVDLGACVNNLGRRRRTAGGEGWRLYALYYPIPPNLGAEHAMGTGGETNHLESVNSVYVYDPQADAWMQLANMGNARRFHASAAVGGKLYVFGFGAASGLLCTAEVYGPASDSWAQVSSLTTVRNSMVAIAL